MRLKDILSVIPIYQTNQQIDEKLSIEHIEIDHRKIKANSIFVCMTGFHTDGHRFAGQAIKNGAKVIVCEEELHLTGAILILVPDTVRALAMIATKFYHYPSLCMPVIGITGTNGKTTTSYLIDKICQTHRLKVGVIGTIQIKIDEQVYQSENTTPDALSLQKTFRLMRDEKIDVVIMEVSSHALQLGRVYGSDFDVAVFTNISQDHLDFHDNMEQYAQAKTLLFSSLGNTYNRKPKFAVINIDDERSVQMIQATNQAIITYGITKRADVTAHNITYTMKHTKFTLVTPVGQIVVTSKLVGRFNLYNILAATTVAITQKISLLTIKTAIESMTGITGRFEEISPKENYSVIIDFAHTPESLQNVLETVKSLTDGKVYVVIGSGGDRDCTKRLPMGEVAVNHSDVAIFTTDNPRTEDPKQIIKDMTASLSRTNYHIVLDRQQAINYAIEQVNEGDVVIIAGKGHETYQEINGVKHPFNDKEIAEIAMKQKGH